MVTVSAVPCALYVYCQWSHTLLMLKAPNAAPLRRSLATRVGPAAGDEWAARSASKRVPADRDEGCEVSIDLGL